LVVDFAAAGATFDGDPEIVRHMLPRPGKRVEQRRLARTVRTDHREDLTSLVVEADIAE